MSRLTWLLRLNQIDGFSRLRRGGAGRPLSVCAAMITLLNGHRPPFKWKWNIQCKLDTVIWTVLSTGQWGTGLAWRLRGVPSIGFVVPELSSCRAARASCYVFFSGCILRHARLDASLQVQRSDSPKTMGASATVGMLTYSIDIAGLFFLCPPHAPRPPPFSCSFISSSSPSLYIPH